MRACLPAAAATARITAPCPTRVMAARSSGRSHTSIFTAPSHCPFYPRRQRNRGADARSALLRRLLAALLPPLTPRHTARPHASSSSAPAQAAALPASPSAEIPLRLLRRMGPRPQSIPRLNRTLHRIILLRLRSASTHSRYCADCYSRIDTRCASALQRDRSGGRSCVCSHSCLSSLLLAAAIPAGHRLRHRPRRRPRSPAPPHRRRASHSCKPPIPPSSCTQSQAPTVQFEISQAPIGVYRLEVIAPRASPTVPRPSPLPRAPTLSCTFRCRIARPRESVVVTATAA